MKIEKQTILGGNQQFADKIINQNRDINTANYVEGNVSGGNIAGRDININNSRHQSFKGTATNSNVNFGDNSILTNTITQLPTENNDLKEVLSQLQVLINNSPLSETTKQKALGKTQDIAEATKQPEAEQKNIVQKILSYFDGLADSLEDIPETAVKLGEMMAKIELLFGL